MYDNNFCQSREAQIRQLRDKLKQYFKNNNVTVSKECPYILAKYSDWPKNIIHPEVVNYINGIRADRKNNKKPFPLHNYIHHGLSSQAFLFNLIGPLIIEKRFDVLKKILKAAGSNPKGEVSSVELEVEDRKVFWEKSGQPTSIDLVIYTDLEEKYFIEFKFTEAGFGGCSLFFNGNCDGLNPSNDFQMCVLDKLKRKYWILLKEYGLLTKLVSNDSRCPFIDFYQAYRVVMFSLANKGEFILMYDERNPAFFGKTSEGERGVYKRFLDYLPDDIKAKCHRITTQKVFNIINSYITDDWVMELKTKYF